MSKRCYSKWPIGPRWITFHFVAKAVYLLFLGLIPITCRFTGSDYTVQCNSLHLQFHQHLHMSWWRHQMETFSALPICCAGNSAQRPVTFSFDVSFDLRLNQQFSKQWRHGCFEIHNAHRNVRLWHIECILLLMLTGLYLCVLLWIMYMYLRSNVHLAIFLVFGVFKPTAMNTTEFLISV